MLLFTLPIAIVIGVLIARNYAPKNKSEKIWASILIPLISGVVINLLIASCMDMRWGFWFNVGRTLLFVAIPEVALLITLFVALEVGGKKNWNDISTMKLHYGTGENRVDFEIRLTQKEILQMAKLREQDPERWKDNELELVKMVKKELYADCAIQKELQEKEPIVENTYEKEIVSEVQEVENEDVSNNTIVENNNPIESEPIHSEKAEEEKEEIGLFGNKLESEYRRESKPEAHWIRQNGTEMCINIDEVTYKKMVEMQNENPKRWVDKELDLFHKAMAIVPNSNMSNQKARRERFTRKSTRKLKWYYVFAIIFGVIITYSVVASVVNHKYAECDENQMISLYIYCNNMKYVRCNNTVFKYRMISSRLYRKKIHSKIFSNTKESFDGFEQQLKISHNMENPFYWLW